MRILAACLAAACVLGAPAQAPPLQKVTINYATRTGTTWPLYIAKEAGYFQKYGLDAKLVFGVHPAGIAMVVSGEAVMTNYPLEQAMIASSRDGSLAIIGSPYRKSLFALMTGKNVSGVRALKGKRLGVSQIGDAPYNYAVALLGKFGLMPRDVEWVPIGTDVNGRAAALVAGRVDATMITAPVYFRLEEQGYKSLANTSDYDDIYAPTVYLFKRATIGAQSKLVEALIKAHTEGIKRFYQDKAFALRAYIDYTQENPEELARVYDRYASTNTFERVPYLTTGAVQYMIDHPVDNQIGAQLKRFDFHSVIDNRIIDKLVQEGFFESLFGASIREEEAHKKSQAFR